jgi:hypothetical protein
MKRNISIFLALVALLVGVAQVQHLFWSTAIVVNESGRLVSLIFHDHDANDGKPYERELVKISAGESRFIVLPKKGEAGLEARVEGDPILSESLYVQEDMYHCTAKVSSEPVLEFSCTLGIFGPIMALEMLKTLI